MDNSTTNSLDQLDDEELSHGIVGSTETDHDSVPNEADDDGGHEQPLETKCLEHNVPSDNAKETLCYTVGEDVERCVASGIIVSDDDPGVKVGMCA